MLLAATVLNCLLPPKWAILQFMEALLLLPRLYWSYAEANLAQRLSSSAPGSLPHSQTSAQMILHSTPLIRNGDRFRKARSGSAISMPHFKHLLRRPYR
jgi:hypothetical protein